MDENKNEFNNQSNEGDDFIIGKGFTLDEKPDKDIIKAAKKHKRKKRGSALKNTVWIISIVVISVGLAFGIIYAGADFLGIGFGRGKDVAMDIPKGTPASEVAERLEETGAVKIPLLFRVYSKLKGYDSQFKYGLYDFNTEAGYEQLAEMLITEGAKAETIKVTIPEGTGINDFVKNVNGERVTVPGIATLLENAGVCSKTDFKAALNEVKLDTRLLKNVNVGKTYYELEGYLFPETYEFYSYDSKESARLAVKKMIEEMENRITDEMYKKAEEMGYSMNEILTMASIIQMEAGIETKTEAAKKKLQENMEGVAGVFYNRLDSAETGGTLGSSPTLFYGDSFKNDDGRYNTQADNDFPAIKGLPPGPLCSPSIEAINAALNPKSSEYYYFVTDSSGNFYFHKTLDEQNTTKAKLKKGQQWTYEYFNRN